MDPEEAATVLDDATAFFLHPAVMPSALANRGEERARNVGAACPWLVSPRKSKWSRCCRPPLLESILFL